MAKLIGPLHSTEARGRVQGLIYNTWRGISYAKAFCGPAQPRSERQILIRSLSTQLARAWQAIDQADRDTWNDYAVSHQETDWTGNPKRISGFNWFVRCNVRLALLSVAQVDTAPIAAAPDPVGGMGLTPAATQITVVWTSPSDPDIKVQIWLDGPRSAGAISSLPRIRWYSDTGSDVATKVVSGLAAGTWTVWVRTLSIDDGQVSAWVQDTCVVPAA